MNILIRFFKYLWFDKGISLAAAWSFNQLAYAIVYPFVPIYLHKVRGMDYSLVSIIFPLLGIANIVAPVPCGWLTDRFGHQVMMLAGQFIRGIIFFCLAVCVYFEAPFWLFAVALMLNTAIGVAFQVGSDAYLTDITQPEQRPGYYSKIRIGYNVGWALGPMMGAFFADTPFWAFFIATGLLCMAGTFQTWFCCCRNSVAVSGRAEKTQHSEESSGLMKEIFGNRRFIFLMLGNLFLMLLVSQLYSTLSVFSTSSVGISSKAMGSIYSMNGTMVLALQIPLIALLKKVKMPIFMQLIAGTLLYVAGYFQLGFAGGALAIAIAVAVVTIGEIIVQPAFYTLVSNETRKGNTGRMMSISSLTRGIGYSAGPWIGAQLYLRSNGIVLWSVLSSFAVCAAVMFLISALFRSANSGTAE